MSAILQIENFGSANVRQQSTVNVDYVSGASLTPKNTDGMAAQLMLLVGRPGDELTEIGQIQSVSGGVVTLVTGLSYPHNKFTPITVLAADQIKIYRTPNVDGTVPTDAAFTGSGVLATSSISPDTMTTYYNDSTGGSGYWYKFIYYNSASALASALADSIAIRGGTVGFYTSIYAIRLEAGVAANRFISDVDIATYRLRAQSTVDSMISGNYTVPLTTPVAPNIDNITATLAAGYLLLADYGPQVQGTTKDGQAKIDSATIQLTSIKTGDAEVFDASGNSLMRSSIKGWPDNTTATQAEFDDVGDRTAGGGSLFGISHKF